MNEHKTALLYTERSRSERDLGKMISHLKTILSDMEGVSVTEEILSPEKSPSYSSYSHLVFCGYDHTTLGHLHLAMASTTPDLVRITLYDEPGAAIDRELNAIMFRGIDSRRMPGSSTTRLVSSWAHRDIVATIRQDVLKSLNGTDRLAHQAPESGTTQSKSELPRGDSGTRKMGAKGATQTRKGNASIRGKTGNNNSVELIDSGDNSI